MATMILCAKCGDAEIYRIVRNQGVCKDCLNEDATYWREHCQCLEALVDEAYSIISEYLPAFEVWLDEAREHLLNK